MQLESSTDNFGGGEDGDAGKKPMLGEAVAA